MSRLTGYSHYHLRGENLKGRFQANGVPHCVPHDSKTQFCAFELSKHIQVHLQALVGEHCRNIAYSVALCSPKREFTSVGNYKVWVQVGLQLTEVLYTSSSTRLGFEPMTSRSCLYISCY